MMQILNIDSLLYVLRGLDVPNLVRVGCVSKDLRVVAESVLRVRTAERGHVHPDHIPNAFATWFSYLAWVEYVTLGLGHSGELVRRRSLDTLGDRLAPSVLAGYAPAVVRKLEDSDWSVRCAALETLRKLQPFVLSWYAPGVVRMLDDNESWVRCEALETLCKLEPFVLARYAPVVVRQFEHSTILCDGGAWDVHKAALITLCYLEPHVLALYAFAVVRMLDADAWFVRLAALNTLWKLDLSVLARYTNKVAGMREDPHGDVRQAAALLLLRLG